MPVPLEVVDDPVAQRNFDTLSRETNQPIPQARVYNDAVIATTTGTQTALTFNQERFDEGDLHSTTANTSRLTAPVTGAYLIGGYAVFASNATGVRQLSIRHQGSTFLASQKAPTVTGEGHDLTVSTVYRLAAGEYVELMARQTSGGNLDVSANPEFWMVRLGGYTGDHFTT